MRLLALLLICFALPTAACGNDNEAIQGGKADNGTEEADKGPMASGTFNGLKWRSIGPAFMSGRISDVKIVQDDPATWYLAVGSGGVWKTENAGTTWKPLFDKQSSYSIGTIGLDPNNANHVWVGTGEDVGGRHVGFGDGVYKSTDGGANWKNMGLKESEHIARILIHPNDPNTVFVASQGPLWSKGGERGLFKTTDGGKTWRNVLSAGPWTGVTDVVMDPREPGRLYAATWQHHRTVANYIGGGPESGIHISEDGGETWRKLTQGLPKGNMGKIGLAISPQRPDVLYAAIELDRRKGGTWRSEDRGSTWKKLSDVRGGGTGPHYYQELYASPHKFDRIYMVSNTSQVSDDGGKNWRAINNQYKHVDDHAIAFHPTDPDFILVGSDGGLYESLDGEKSWRYMANLPITQFYKVAVDDTEPFYNVYGGTQDNNSQGGPSRTDNRHGIRNSDWFITLFADGHQSAVEPGNPDITYVEWQEGNLARIDQKTGEIVHIQPQAAPGEPVERYNWDAPILVSAHDPKRIYFGSYRVWRSDNRGDDWEAKSGDLTRNENRMLLPVMDKQWSWDAGWDYLAMSQYNTITSLAESPLDENVLYAGTDDGLIQATRDGGANWTRIEVGSLPGVPETAFVNDLRADLYDPGTVYVALDNHKFGDFKPYLLKSTNYGRTWVSIADDLPDRHLVWRMVQDHVNKDLLFAATEFGVFFTPNGGEKWVELKSGMPTIALRDITIQRRENDLVAASFGRGFYILDDYTPLRSVTAESLEQDAMLFPGRRAWWYMEQHPMGFSEGGSQGHGFYRAENPPFGAVFTYYLKEDIQSLKETRQAAEKPLLKKGEGVAFVGFDAVEAERLEEKPVIMLTVRDSDGNVVRQLTGPAKKGFHRVAWNLRFPSVSPVTSNRSRGGEEPSGFLAAPGTYTVSLAKRVRGETTQLSGPQQFTVERMGTPALQGMGPEEVAAFWQDLSRFQRSVTAATRATRDMKDRLELMATAIARTPATTDALIDQHKALTEEIQAIDTALNGNGSMNELGLDQPATVRSRLGQVMTATSQSTYGPTAHHLKTLGYARDEFEGLYNRINTVMTTTIPALETAMVEAGSPYVPGGPLPRP